MRGVTCSICEKGSCDFETRCGHFLHKKCLEKYFGSVGCKKCPVCYEKIITKCENVEKFFKSPINFKYLMVEELVLTVESVLEDDQIIPFPYSLDTFIDYISLLKVKLLNESFDSSCFQLCLKACRYGRLDVVKKLIQFKTVKGDVIFDMKRGQLQMAVFSGNKELLQYLIDEPSLQLDINDNFVGYSALRIASITGDLEIFDLLIKNGADIEQIDNYSSDSSILLYACQSAHFLIVKRLIELGADLHRVDDINKNALHYACKEKVTDHVEMFKYFNVPKFDKSEGDRLEIVKLLLEKGVSLEVKSNFDDTPIGQACWSGYSNIFDYFLEFSNEILRKPIDPKEHFLLNSVSSGTNFELFERILSMIPNLNVNQLKSDGDSALMAACRSGSAKIIKKLIELGADVNLVDDSDWNAFLYLCGNGRDDLESFEVLLEVGANIKKLNNCEQNGLLLAAKNKAPKLVKRLLELGLKPNKKDDDESTPLHAILKNSTEDEEVILKIVKILLAYGANSKVKDILNRTPEDYARNYNLGSVTAYFVFNTNLKGVPKRSIRVMNYKE